MQINVKKSTFLTISLHRNLKLSPANLHINGHPLIEVEQMKLLGVIITRDLKSKAHLEVIAKKCARGMFFVRQLSRFGDADATWMYYLAMVFSHLAYCWPVICDAPASILGEFVR